MECSVTEFENSKFFRIIQSAIYLNLDSLISELYYCLSGSLINGKLELIYFDGPAEMEKAVRILTATDILFNCLGGKFRVINVPEDKIEDIIWFVKLFAYLESETSIWELSKKDKIYKPSKDVKSVFSNERIKYIVDISELRFLYRTVEVLVN